MIVFTKPFILFNENSTHVLKLKCCLLKKGKKLAGMKF
jgi:hypothetical protein